MADNMNNDTPGGPRQVGDDSRQPQQAGDDSHQPQQARDDSRGRQSVQRSESRARSHRPGPYNRPHKGMESSIHAPQNQSVFGGDIPAGMFTPPVNQGSQFAGFQGGNSFGNQRGRGSGSRGSRSGGFQPRRDPAPMHHVDEITIQTQKMIGSNVVSMAAWNSSEGGGSDMNIFYHLPGMTKGATVCKVNKEEALCRGYKEQMEKGGSEEVVVIFLTPEPRADPADEGKTVEVSRLEINPNSRQARGARLERAERKRKNDERKARAAKRLLTSMEVDAPAPVDPEQREREIREANERRDREEQARLQQQQAEHQREFEADKARIEAEKAREAQQSESVRPQGAPQPPQQQPGVAALEQATVPVQSSAVPPSEGTNDDVQMGGSDKAVCDNCGLGGHSFTQCLLADDEGLMRGCVICSDVGHDTVACDKLPRDNLGQIYQIFVEQRKGMPALHGMDWFELACNYVQQCGEAPNMGFPWSQRHAVNVKTVEKLTNKAIEAMATGKRDKVLQDNATKSFHAVVKHFAWLNHERAKAILQAPPSAPAPTSSIQHGQQSAGNVVGPVASGSSQGNIPYVSRQEASAGRQPSSGTSNEMVWDAPFPPDA